MSIKTENDMICDICNTENKAEAIKCTKCDVLLETTDTPLSGNERVRLLSFAIVAFLSPPFLPIVFILAAYAIYVMKIDKRFNSIINAKKYINKYFLTLAMILIIGMSILVEVEHYGHGHSSTNFLWIILIAILGRFIIPYIYNFLFFDIMEKHRNFIVKNGIFADGSNDKVNILGREGVNSFSIAGEWLKWNELLEKKMITKDEFNKAKAKIWKNNDK